MLLLSGRLACIYKDWELEPLGTIYGRYLSTFLLRPDQKTVFSCASGAPTWFQISLRPLAFVAPRTECHFSSGFRVLADPEIRASILDIGPEHDGNGTSVLYERGQDNVD